MDGAFIATISQLWLLSATKSPNDEERGLGIIRQIRFLPSAQGTVPVSGSLNGTTLRSGSQYLEEQRYRMFRHRRRGAF